VHLLNGTELLQLELLITDILIELRVRKILISSSSLQVLLSLDLRDLLNLALQGHVRLLQVLDVLVLHLVHVDTLQDLRIVSQNEVGRTIRVESPF
jgi:hypothetical protein